MRPYTRKPILLNAELKNLMCAMHQNGIFLQDMVGLLVGLRPMIRISINNKKSYFLMKSFSSKTTFQLVTCQPRRPQSVNVFLGPKISKLQEAREYDLISPETIGTLLGYPSCCIRHYISRIKNWDKNGQYEKTPPFPYSTLQRTRQKKSLNFLLNYIFAVDSRVPSFRSSKVNNLTKKGYFLQSKYFIPHIPCSFECQKSLNFAQKLFSLLDNYFPYYKLDLEYYLKKPVLFFDEYTFLPLIGKADADNTVAYSGLIPPHNFLDRSTFLKISKGNSLRIKKGGKGVLIMRNHKKVETLKKKGIIFNFQ